MRTSKLVLFACIAGVFLVLIAYFTGGRADRSDPIVYGPIEAEGVLTSTGISLVRRGTHVLVQDGISTYYLESTRHSLREFEGRNVRLTGVREPNVSREYKTVILVEEIETLDGEGEESELRLPALGISLSVPARWNPVLQSGVLSVYRDEKEEPFLTVRQDASLHAGNVPQGMAVRVGGRSGMRVDDERTGTKTVYVFDERGTLVFSFFPAEASVDLSDAFMRALLSVRFLDEPSSGPPPATGTGAPLPCGGPAGILCPSGQYCNVTDFELNIGECRSAY